VQPHSIATRASRNSRGKVVSSAARPVKPRKRFAHVVEL
jgi:hypothetical protein